MTSLEKQTTIAMLPDHLNQIGSGRRISTHLEELVGDEQMDPKSLQLNLDLGRVEKITSAGLNELIGINCRARSHGIRLVLLDVQDSVRDIFALTRLERIFEFRCSTTGA